MQGHLPHPATPASDTAFLINRAKKRRGSYNCGRCGLPKKGHTCPDPTTPVSADPPTSSGLLPVPRRRALSFGDVGSEEQLDLDEEDPDPDLYRSCGLQVNCLWEIFRRLPPSGLLSAARVCHGWRETARKFWRAAEELRLRVPAGAHVGFFGSVLQKCPGLLRLSLNMESDIDATVLACIAFSCPNLQALEIFTSGSSINRISGDELGRFISEKRCLTSLKMEGCSNLGSLVFSSTTLSTLWLSDLHSLSKMICNCPILMVVSLSFSCRENDRTDLTAALDGIGRSCPKLESIHVASTLLSNAAVLALSASNLRRLRMLSLVLGSEITDASVAAVTSGFPELELLDLSGSSISDSGIGMICNVYPETLTKLLLAICPNITSSGIQFASAQLPLLELMDCGMTICDPDSDLLKTSNTKVQHLIHQKLIIKHSRLKRLSLWGCTGLDALYLNCPNLSKLNLNSCQNLHPDRLLLECPNLESVHASDCEESLIKSIKAQVCSDLSPAENCFPSKRLPDGSKRVGVPHFCSSQEVKGGVRLAKHRQCSVFLGS